jgi:fumarylpyruvate hydrolase
MSSFAILPPARPSLPVEGTACVFPIRRILCVGRNYAAHTREMGGDDRDLPFFFSKPADSIVVCRPGQCPDVPYPSATNDLHHEVELVAALASGGANLSPEQGLEAVYGYAVGVDLTRRDLQNGFKAKGQPWDAAKGFDFSAPISPIRRKANCNLSQDEIGRSVGAIGLEVDGQIRQKGRLEDMIWSVGETIAQASRLWTLAAGDLIFTGTPEGVGPINPSQTVHCFIEGVGDFKFKISEN